jgi:hypothetical protein
MPLLFFLWSGMFLLLYFWLGDALSLLPLGQVLLLLFSFWLGAALALLLLAW